MPLFEARLHCNGQIRGDHFGYLARYRESRQAREFVGIKTQRQPDSQDAAGKKQRVRFRFRNRYFHREKDEEGRGHDEALQPPESKVAIEAAGAEVNGDGAHDTDRVQAGKGIEISGQHQDENWKRDGGEQGKLRNAVAIQPRQLSRHLAVLGHHENHADQRYHRGIHRTEKQKTEDNTDCNPEHSAKPGRYRHCAVVFREKTQHVLFVIGQLRPKKLW